MLVVRCLCMIFALFVISALGSTKAQAQGVHLHAVLVGGNEVGGGDPNGYGTAALHFRAATELCVAIIMTRISKPTAAHIHKEFAPKNGPIVIPLATPATGDPGSSVGCVTVASNFYTDIRANPSQFYVNVHSTEFPGGAIRGQLFQ